MADVKKEKYSADKLQKLEKRVLVIEETIFKYDASGKKVIVKLDR